MKVNTLKSPPVNQNGYHKNTLTKERIGTLFIYPIDYTPDDCLSCDGYSLQINDYEELYKIIGTKFNQSDDAIGTFRVPDYNITKRFLQPGDGAGVLIAAGLPKHTHSATITSAGAHTHTAQSAGAHQHYLFGVTGGATSDGDPPRNLLNNTSYVRSSGGAGYGRYLLYPDTATPTVGLSNKTGNHTHSTDSNGAHTHSITINETSGSLYGATTTVQPPSQLVHICIKYK